MLNDNPDAGDETVVRLLFWSKLFSFGFLLWLKRPHSLWLLSLKASIFIHIDVCRGCGAFFIRNLFIMPFAFIGLTQIIDFACMEAAKHEILDRVCFFLPL